MIHAVTCSHTIPPLLPKVMGRVTVGWHDTARPRKNSPETRRNKIGYHKCLDKFDFGKKKAILLEKIKWHVHRSNERFRCCMSV